MSPYVVPDRAQPERKLPTALTPTFWAALSIVPFDSLDPTQSKVILDDDVPAEVSVLSEESTNTSTQASKLADPPHVEHEYYFFDDGNVTFLVEGILYRVHKYFFCRDSSEFRDRLSHLSTQQERGPPPIIPLDDVESVDFDAFLSVLYPPDFDRLEERSFEEWSSILDLSTRWGFTSICDLALRCVEPPNPLQQLVLARKYSMEEWINPALLELCERQEPLSLDEARLMDFEDVVLVGSVRQTVRSSDLVVDGAGIREHIQAWGSEEPSSPVSEPSDICTLSVGPQSPPLDWAPSPPLATPNTIFTHPPLDFSSQPAGSSSLFGGNTVSETTESFPWPAPSKKTKRGKKKKVSIFQ